MARSLRLALALALALPGAALGADVTRVLELQGTLLTGAGVPVAGNFDLTFRLFAAQSGGSPLWTTGPAPVTVAGGVFDVSIGPVPDGLIEAGGTLWLEVVADTETLPRRPLRASPYALLAQKANHAALAADVQCTGCVGTDDVAFAWAAGASPGGAATGLQCSGCVDGGEIVANVALAGTVTVAGGVTACSSAFPSGPGCAVAVGDAAIVSHNNGWLSVQGAGLRVLDATGTSYRPLDVGAATVRGDLTVLGSLTAASATLGGPLACTGCIGAGAIAPGAIESLGFVKTSSLAPVALSGQYSDLVGAPGPGVSTSTANTFTALQTFAAGISVTGGSVNLGSAPILGMRLQNAGSHPVTCGADQEGYVYWNTADKAIWVCNGTTFEKIGAASLPYGSTSGNPGQSCLDIKETLQSATSGLYWIDPDGGSTGNAVRVYCDMTTDGGGWTLLAKTVLSGLTADERATIRNGTWQTYTQDGYGSPESASRIYWMPLSLWNLLLEQAGSGTLWSKTSAAGVRVTGFTVDGADQAYAWAWTGVPSGWSSIEPALNGAKFTTWDNDNDIWSSNCAKDNVGYNGGFWYTDCYQLSMLHANGSLYALFNNVGTSVTYNEIYYRPESSGPGKTKATALASCKAILDSVPSSPSGMYWIDPNGGTTSDAFRAYCDMTTYGGGWTLVAKTVNSGLTSAQQDAVRKGTWSAYSTTGYGSPYPADRIYWMPLTQWNLMTASGTHELWSKTSASTVRVTGFQVANAAAKFAWTWTGAVSGFSSIENAIKGAKFTTWDQDNDTWSSNCAKDNVGFNGGFWYTDCYQISMLHANGSLYAWFNNVGTSVSSNEVYIR
ncbi:MAG: hypothetical protein AMXMBFR64_23170 [Myxococcales bacterium]